jgi:putative serine protease PepD
VSRSKHARRRRWLPWAAAGAALVAGGVIGGVVGATTASSSPAVTSGTTAVSACAVTSVADQVVPSVVTIHASGDGKSGTGSGEVIRSDGYILTNNHVISIAAHGGKVEVLFSDGQTVPATITGRDPQTDLAVIKIQTSSQLKVIALGTSSTVTPGGSWVRSRAYAACSAGHGARHLTQPGDPGVAWGVGVRRDVGDDVLATGRGCGR